MLVLIRGAGDLASGIALRLYRCGYQVAMTDLAQPTAIRRTVSFSQAIWDGQAQVEGVQGIMASNAEEALALMNQGHIPVLADPEGACIPELKPGAVVDAVLAKRNMGTSKEMAPVVIGVGPGFTAGVDCHAVVETQRGHNLGRVYEQGSAAPDTGVPGNIGGYSRERVLRAPCSGIFQGMRQIGDLVNQGDVVATVDGRPMTCLIGGVLRGLLPSGISVTEGMKSGDVDPRGVRENCFTVSDKARAVGGGVLEALLRLERGVKQ